MCSTGKKALQYKQNFVNKLDDSIYETPSFKFDSAEPK